MKSKQVRQKFLDFFKQRNHAIISGASLIPENDPTTLFIGSGMQPLLPYLLGKKHSLGKRLVNCQKSFRALDIEEVGDSRHTTFFEMLGNWSLGDYFKKEQLGWIFDFLTKELGINPKKLYVTVFQGNKKIGVERDEESVKVWKEIFSKKNIEAKAVDFSEKNGMREGRIFYYDETKNWWSRSGRPEAMPFGEPGGPDSEIFYDLGEELNHHQKKNNPCHVNCDCGRFIEIGNSVFMEYIKTEKGFEKLPQKNVDFGGGLERITMVVQKKKNIFETDLFSGILSKIKELSEGKKYEDNIKAFEVIADHIKGSVFIISEGVFPSNTERGYILRRLLRRSIRYGKILKLPRNFLIPLAQEVIKTYKEVYPEIALKEEETLIVIQREEEKFEKTLDQGLKKLNYFLKKGKISGIDIFHLYDTYGFPSELTEELVKEKGLNFNREEFRKAFKKHQEISRAGKEAKFGGIGKGADYQATKLHTATHLLQSALKKVLGEKVSQAGSDITSQRLRFDFFYPRKMTKDEIKKTEDIVNQKIKENLEIKKKETTFEKAKKEGALFLEKEKYPEKVTVYSTSLTGLGQIFSKEICAGPHVKKTGELGKFKIIKEESSGANIRRIRATLI